MRKLDVSVFQCKQSQNFVSVLQVMATDEGSKSNFVCEIGCGKSYGALKNLRKHQRLQNHGEVDSGKLKCPVDQCSRRYSV